ncbi:hypothetical protein PYW07_016638 [Mythimna separata]|uniref:MIT domain-containing protein n=1 Tax=Mythimna separata TaxID=271217 RepID=A0AAD7YKV0_MYTSE|nr:hypothetical protein PYW07_016638 [Mythimna separata]
MGGQSSTTRNRPSTGKQTANIMESPTDILEKGLDVLKKAVEEDKKGHYEEALRLYVQVFAFSQSNIMGGLCSTTRDKANAGKQTANIMEEGPNLIQKGVDVFHKAVEEDKNKNYEEALRYYVQGVMLFHAAEYHAVGERTKNLIKAKCAQYILRVQKLKTYRNQIYFDNLETLSDSNVLNIITEIICMCGDFMEQPEKESENEKTVTNEE